MASCRGGTCQRCYSTVTTPESPTARLVRNAPGAPVLGRGRGGRAGARRADPGVQASGRGGHRVDEQRNGQLPLPGPGAVHAEEGGDGVLVGRVGRGPGEAAHGVRREQVLDRAFYVLANAE